MYRSSSLSDLLNRSDESRDPISRHQQNLVEEYSHRSQFRYTEVSNELQSDLNNIRDYIVNLSQRCLTKLNEWNTLLLGMDTEINEFAGIFQRVKSDKGTRAVQPMMCKGGAPILPPITHREYNPSKFSFPDYAFNINMHVLDKVGQTPFGQGADPDCPNAPLIQRIPPGTPKASFWTEPSDFFCPITDTNNIDPMTLRTSFSSFYGFNPSSNSSLAPSDFNPDSVLVPEASGNVQQQYQDYAPPPPPPSSGSAPPPPPPARPRPAARCRTWTGSTCWRNTASPKMLRSPTALPGTWPGTPLIWASRAKMRSSLPTMYPTFPHLRRQ